jgi:hypothetical protein
MIIIAHRGNLTGSNPYMENRPEYIDQAIEQGYNCEVDVWYHLEKGLMLGHDEPLYSIELDWLWRRSSKLWIHCKNLDALGFLSRTGQTLNYFWHEKDTCTLTSKHWIWCYPGVQAPAGYQTVAVMPESQENFGPLDSFKAICTDNAIDFNKVRTNDKTDLI